MLLFLFGTTYVLSNPISEMINLIKIYLGSNPDDDSLKLIDKQLTNVKNAESELKDELRKVKLKFIKRDEFSQVYQILNKLSKKNGIKIEKLHPEALKSDSLFSIFPVRIGFKADFHQILKFLTAIESELPGCHITFLKIENHLHRSQKLEVEFMFETFGHKDDDENKKKQ